MPWNDYISLLLVNTSAGLLVLAAFFYWGLNSPRPQVFAPALAGAGLISLAMGLHMVLTWPLHDGAAFANVCFGEPSVLFGTILLASALSVARRWPMHGVALLGLVGGLVLIVIGVRIHNAGLTQAPDVTCAGFCLTGLLGLLALPTVANPTKVLRTFTAVLTLLAALLWGGMGLFAYWGHVAAAAGIK
jgi:putative membrane protein